MMIKSPSSGPGMASYDSGRQDDGYDVRIWIFVVGVT